MPAAPLVLYVDPPTHHFLGDRLFAPETNPLAGDNILAPYLAIRERFAAAGIPVHTADRLPAAPDGRTHVYTSLGMRRDYAALARRPDVVLSAYLALECPIVEPTLYAGLPAVARHVRRVLCFAGSEALRPFTGAALPIERFVWPQCFDGVHPVPWARTDRGFLTMINANKLPRLYRDELYTKRLEAVAYFHAHGGIDLYGKGWDHMPMRVGKTWVPATLRRLHARLWDRWQAVRPHPLYATMRAAWKGSVASKAETLSRYTFALCFENMPLQGWVTEKIFDCFFAGTVPVYWGAPEIAELVPPEAFIDMRQFRDYAELHRHLKALGPREIARHREAARAFVESPAYRPFTAGAFAERFARFVAEDTGVIA